VQIVAEYFDAYHKHNNKCTDGLILPTHIVGPRMVHITKYNNVAPIQLRSTRNGATLSVKRYGCDAATAFSQDFRSRSKSGVVVMAP
jgi:hypothetical protein